MNLILFLTVLIWIYMSLAFVVATIRQNNGLADIAWGVGFILVALGTVWHTGQLTERGLLLLILVILWGTRLALHILARNQGKPYEV